MEIRRLDFFFLGKNLTSNSVRNISWKYHENMKIYEISDWFQSLKFHVEGSGLEFHDAFRGCSGELRGAGGWCPGGLRDYWENIVFIWAHKISALHNIYIHIVYRSCQNLESKWAPVENRPFQIN